MIREKAVLQKELSRKLRSVRQKLGLSQQRISAYFETTRDSVTKREQGLLMPPAYWLYVLSDQFDISLDWLVSNKGPMFYKEKLVEVKGEDSPQEVTKDSPPSIQVHETITGTVREELKEMIKDLEQVPVLRYELLAHYHKFKLKNKGILYEEE
ncbi:MAG: helix-turn-helix transcriptional regulator [bacterium]|nr:helix-turn-helix transcriptional regulator [bacterium]